MGSELLFLGGAEGIRTPDPLHAMEVRYQLRYSPARPWPGWSWPEGRTWEDRTSTVERSYPAAAATSTAVGTAATGLAAAGDHRDGLYSPHRRILPSHA